MNELQTAESQARERLHELKQHQRQLEQILETRKTTVPETEKFASERVQQLTDEQERARNG